MFINFVHTKLNNKYHAKSASTGNLSRLPVEALFVWYGLGSWYDHDPKRVEIRKYISKKSVYENIFFYHSVCCQT